MRIFRLNIPPVKNRATMETEKKTEQQEPKPEPEQQQKPEEKKPRRRRKGKTTEAMRIIHGEITVDFK
jgi:hypothetical protein